MRFHQKLTGYAALLAVGSISSLSNLSATEVPGTVLDLQGSRVTIAVPRGHDAQIGEWVRLADDPTEPSWEVVDVGSKYIIVNVPDTSSHSYQELDEGEPIFLTVNVIDESNVSGNKTAVHSVSEGSSTERRVIAQQQRPKLSCPNVRHRAG